VLEVIEKNARLRNRIACFEIGPVFWPVEGQQLPDEPQQLALALFGQRLPSTWNHNNNEAFDFYDLKGVLEGLFEALHIPVRFVPTQYNGFHPGQCAEIYAQETRLGVMGALHPETQARFDLPGTPSVLAAELNLAALLPYATARRETRPVAIYPPVLEDLAIVVEEELPGERVEAVIRQAGGNLLSDVRLFDVFRSEALGPGKKSLAYSLTYQSQDGTLTDTEASKIRQRIIRRLEQELGAKLRS
jgi:phenylalanyl-tRNA synthetase beta chain